MELSKEQREKIYHEEIAARKGSSFSATPFLFSLLAGAGIVALFYLAKSLDETKPDLEELRKAYSGLPPEDSED